MTRRGYIRRQQRDHQIAFQPSNISGQVGWWIGDTNDASSDGTAISTWTDQSTNGANLTSVQDIGRPTQQSNIVNGHSVLRFDGTNDLLKTADATVIAAFGGEDSPFTVFCVVNIATDVSDNDVFWGCGDETGGESEVTFSRVLASGTTWAHSKTDDAGSTSDTSGGTAAGDTWYVVTTIHTGTAVTLRHNRTVAINAVANNVGTLSLDNFVVGGLLSESDVSPAAPLGGDIAECIVYDVELSSINFNRVEAYLASKYGIVLA